jgi:IPT/TIG domain
MARYPNTQWRPVPNQTPGAAGGRDSVTVTGTRFTGATGVGFCKVAATNLAVASDIQLTVTIPPANASGPVDVTVTTPVGTSAATSADQFTVE